MQAHRILKHPNTILQQPSRKVHTFSLSLKHLVDEMLATMQATSGVGIAANQVGALERVIICQPPEADPLIMVNPEITRQQGIRYVSESCLSLPGAWGLTARSEQVRVRALDLQGREFRIQADGLLAQIIEHEIDHIEGILYTERLAPRHTLRYDDTPPQQE